MLAPASSCTHTHATGFYFSTSDRSAPSCARGLRGRKRLCPCRAFKRDFIESNRFTAATGLVRQFSGEIVQHAARSLQY
jgi:hypothetical protein